MNTIILLLIKKKYMQIVEVRNLNESKKPSTNFAKESPKEDGRESGIDPDTLDETSTSMIGNSLSLNDMKCTTNDLSNTTEVNKPSVITILRRLARYLALRIANKRHSLATANQHVARNAIEEKLLRSRLSELNIDYHYHHHHNDHLVNSWNSFNSMEINYGTIVNRFDRLHNNTIAVIQLLCQLARCLAILDGQLYCLNKNQYNNNVILLCNNNDNNDPLIPCNHYTTSLINDTSTTMSNHLLNDFNDKDNDNDDGNSQCELSQIIEQQKRLIIQIKEAQLLRAELETCRHRLLESIPGHIKCDVTHNIIDKLGRDFVNNNQLTTTTSNNTADKATYKQNITQLKLTSSSSASSYTTNKELEQSFNDQQSIMNTTQFLRQRVTEAMELNF
uniref:RUN domain-containing protein n=1 Tax=Schistosoma mansoni TaxID=6183 RepID=A0A5K4FA36_SCHMA